MSDADINRVLRGDAPYALERGGVGSSSRGVHERARAEESDSALKWVVLMAALLGVFVVGDVVLCGSQASRQHIDRQ
jgi:hypothetical protein